MEIIQKKISIQNQQFLNQSQQPTISVYNTLKFTNAKDYQTFNESIVSKLKFMFKHC